MCIRTHTHTHTYVYIYIYLCTCCHPVLWPAAQQCTRRCLCTLYNMASLYTAFYTSPCYIVLYGGYTVYMFRYVPRHSGDFCCCCQYSDALAISGNLNLIDLGAACLLIWWYSAFVYAAVPSATLFLAKPCLSPSLANWENHTFYARF